MKTLALTYTPYLNRLMATLAGIMALSLFLYGVFLLEAVAHTASRTEAERQIARYTSELSALETKYLTLTKDITLERAYEMGLEKPARVTTVYAGTDALSVSYQQIQW